jgi:GntR family transcriptional regulator/MocR family aminotransferase
MRERRPDAHESEGTVALLSLTLDRGAAEPLVRQLYLHLRELILTRRLVPGTRLPSTRRLSRDLLVSRTVTLDAFGQLTAEGFLEGRRGAGHYIVDLPLPRAESGSRDIERTGDIPEPSIWSARGRPFDPAWQSVDLFPARTWTRMLGRGWRRHQDSAIERHWAGLPALREALAAHLHALRGVPLTPDQVMVTAGSADALALIVRSLPQGRSAPPSAWIEDPGLGVSRQSLESAGVRTVPVPVDGEGLRVDEGERLAPGAALALVTPTRQFPLGMTLSLPRRLALLDWSRRLGAMVVDDDYDGEIRFAGRPLQSLAGLDSEARVLTLGSFSKLTFPGLRLGYATGRADVIARLIECRRQSHVLVPTSSQVALAEFIATGGFARHLRALRLALTRRRAVLVEALRREASEWVEILPQEVGMHVTVRLSPHLARRAGDVDLAARGRENGLVLLPLSQQYAGGKGECGFFLGFAGWAEDEICSAVERFATLLKDAAAR